MTYFDGAECFATDHLEQHHHHTPRGIATTWLSQQSPVTNRVLGVTSIQNLLQASRIIPVKM